MYAFEPSEEQRMLVESVQRYANNNLRPAAHDDDEGGEIPQALINKGWELGLLQASVPEAYGGFGERSALTGVLAAEELAYGDISTAMAVMAPAAFALPILAVGTEEQKKQWLSPVVEADWKPYSAAFIEPSYDFYAGDMQAKAVADGDGYVLTGEKAFVLFADQAPAILVYAALDGRPQAFIVPAGTPGVKAGEHARSFWGSSAMLAAAEAGVVFGCRPPPAWEGQTRPRSAPLVAATRSG